MDTMYIGVSVDDVALDGYSTPEHLENLLRFWKDQKIKGTLFTVPCSDGKKLSDMTCYIDILKQAIADGHEIAQHGLDHTRFQTGIPPKMVLDLPHEGPARKYLAENRDKIEASLSVENLQKTLAIGRDLIESALDIKVNGFRAPCLSTCDNLFIALNKENYLYDSSCVFQEAAWDLINNPDALITPLPINRRRFDHFQVCKTTRTLPSTAEYTWYPKREAFENFLNLAKHDFDACLKARIPFTPHCHVSPIQEGNEDCGFDFYRELLQYARQQAKKQNLKIVSATMSNIAKNFFYNL